METNGPDKLSPSGESKPQPTAIAAAPGAALPLEREEHRLTVLMFTDLVNSSGLKVTLGDVEYVTKIARPHNEIFRALLFGYAGAREINYTGDGFLATFQNVADAVEMALCFHRALRTHRWEAEAALTRIGIHLGEVVILRGGDDASTTIASHAADMCARLMSLGVGGQTLLTRHVFDDARQYVRAHPWLHEGGDAPPLEWVAHGPYLFKGKEDPVEVFEVGAKGMAPLTPPPDAEKAKRAVRPGDEETLGWRPAKGIEMPGRAGWMVMEKLGEGGFGEVWQAQQAKTGQRRVLKFCFDEERLRSFKRELTLFRLIREALGDREDIARLYDVKLDAPPFFLESEFAEQGNLVDWCVKQGGFNAIPLERRLEILALTAEALAAAHSIGILHKDMKPQNILMQARGSGPVRPQITDFGIGGLVNKEALSVLNITAAGFTANTLAHESGSSGTRLYTPPEQLSGRPYTVQGDVYALGVMLYQMVVGDFSRALAPGWERDVSDDLLREDIADCVDGDPARRFASATELASRLQTLPERHASRESARGRAERNARRRHFTRLALAASGALAIAAGALGFGLLRERGLRQRADAAEKLSRDRLGQAEKARDAAESLIADAIFGLRDKLIPIGKIGVLEGMEKAAEDYYRNLPPELASVTTRHHQVRLALNRAIVAGARSDDDATEEGALASLAMARELARANPADLRFVDDQTAALLLLIVVRSLQDAPDEAAAYSAEARKLADGWQDRDPKATQPLVIKLWVAARQLLAMGDQGASPSTALPVFFELQSIAERLKALGGESIETATVDALGKLGRAMVIAKGGNDLLAKTAYQESDKAFREAIERYGEHLFSRQLMLVARNFGIGYLQRIAEKPATRS